jgi:hypothetical protein
VRHKCKDGRHKRVFACLGAHGNGAAGLQRRLFPQGQRSIHFPRARCASWRVRERPVRTPPEVRSSAFNDPFGSLLRFSSWDALRRQAPWGEVGWMLFAPHHGLVPLVEQEVSLGEKKTKQTNQCNSSGLAAVEAAGRANGGRRRVPANLGNKKKTGGWGVTWSGQFAGWIPGGGAE